MLVKGQVEGRMHCIWNSLQLQSLQAVETGVFHGSGQIQEVMRSPLDQVGGIGVEGPWDPASTSTTKIYEIYKVFLFDF